MLSTIDCLIMGNLARHPSSGYDLRNWLERDGRFNGYRASLSPIYRALAKLVEQSYVEFDVSERQNAPDAKVYRLTAEGRAALLAWAREPHEPAPRPMDPDFGIKFIFGGQFGRDIAISILRAELDYRIEQKKDIGTSGGSMGPMDPVPELDPSWAARVQTLSHARGYASTAAYIAWLELTLAQLEAEEEAALAALSDGPGRSARASDAGLRDELARR